MELRGLAVIVLLFAVFVCVDADYRLQIRVFSYNNPTHRCAGCGPQQTCCDGSRTESCNGPEQCDNHFIFCLRPLRTSDFDTQFCPLGRYSARFVVLDQDSFTFEEGEQVNLLPNPLVFTGPTWPGGAQLYAVVTDVDDAFLQLVDRFIIDQNVEVGTNFSTPTNHSGEFNFGHFVLSFQVTCTENFYGSDCATFCMERDDELGHYTCDSEGSIICRERFYNLSTNCTECREGYTGNDCATDLDPCGLISPCENGATCSNTAPDQYECLCAAGFEGDSCERETNECDPNPCMNGGSCTNLLLAAGYSCSCAAGFEGDSCERETNECDPNPCMNGGSCTDLLAGYSCSCAAGFEGDSCAGETNDCDPNPCLNGGACIDLLAGYNCSCLGGFSGTNCDQEEGGNSGGTSETLLVPVVGGVAGGLLFLVMVVVTVVVCLCIKLRNKTPAASKDHTPPKENIDLKPNPVYGICTSEEICAVHELALQPGVKDCVLNSPGHTPPQEDIELNLNPGYGLSVPQESQTNADYYALDYAHKASGTMTDVYDYVLN